MKNLVAFAAIAAVLVIALFVSRSLRGDGSTPAQRGAAIAVPGSTETALAEPGVTPTLDGAAGERAPVTRTGSKTGATPLESRERFGAWSGAERWLVGRVALPSGVPPDPTLRIMALRNSLPAKNLYGAEGLVARVLGPEGMDAANADLEEAVGGQLFAMASVQPDGAFRLPLPAEATGTWLALEGRYLFSRILEELAFEAGTTELGPVDVSPAVGSYVTGSVTLPIDVEPTALIFGGITVEIGPDSATFSLVTGGDGLFRRSTPIDSKGHFAFRAVDTDRAYEVLVKSDRLADYLEDGLIFEAGRNHDLACALGHGALVTGTVVNAKGDPVGGARITARQTAIWGFPGQVLAETASEADGKYELKAVPRGRPLVIASKQGFLESAAKTLEVSDRDRLTDLHLTLNPGMSIRGEVRFADGSPAVAASVTVEFDPEALMSMNAFNAARGAEGSATTDEEGRFAVGGLGKGPFLVQVASLVGEGDDAVRYVVRRNGVKPDTDLDLVLEQPPLVHGLVLDAEGAPVKVFELVAANQGSVFWAGGSSQRRSYTTEDGSFTYDGLTEGVWSLEIGAPGFGPSAPQEVTLPQAEDAEPLMFVMAPAATAAGTVTDPNGNPVVGARVTLFVDALRSFAQLIGRLQLPETYTEEDGTFELGRLPAGSQSLVASHPDYAVSEPVPIELEPGKSTDELLLKLRRGGTILGEAFTKEGNPSVGAQVIIQNTTNWQAITSRTEADGTFRQENMLPGQWSVTVMNVATTADESKSDDDMSGFLENMHFVMVDVKEGEEHLVSLGGRPEDPIKITGKVTHGGEPVEGAMVSFFPDGAEGFGDMKFTQLDATGHYELELEGAGGYLVQVQSFGEGGSSEQNNVEFSKTVPEGEQHELNLELPLGTIRGRVTGPDREPLRSARVTLTTDGGVAFGTFMGGQYGETTTDDDGGYEFRYVRPGSYSVAAGGALFSGAFGKGTDTGRQVKDGLRISEGQVLDDVDFRLSEPGEIAGIVRDPAGRPVSGASIFVHDETGRPLERFSMTTTSSDGRFSYVGVTPGRYVVSARNATEASSNNATVSVTEGRTIEAEVTLNQATVLLVRVTDKRGGDVRANVLVVDESGRQVNGMLAYADLANGISGGFSTSEQRVGPLPPGRYTISATASDGRKTKKTVELSGQPERRLKLRLKE